MKTVYLFKIAATGQQFDSTTSKAVLRGLIEYYWRSIMSGIIQVVAVEVAK